MEKKISTKTKKMLIILFLIMTFVSASVIGANDEVSGIWEGDLSGISLVFNLEFSADGSFQATMDSPDQGAMGIPVSNVLLNGSELKIEVGMIKGIFEGKLNEELQICEGVWSQNSYNIPLVLKKRKEGEGEINMRPQEPQAPYPYEEEEVSYMNIVARVKLAGTLTIPEGEGPFPAVLLITGSGSQDRDETIMGHKPFKVIADYLTRQGIAVLRVDDRGIGGSTGNPLIPTTADLAEDVVSGVEFLKGRPEINSKMIGLIGHSEGGIIAPIVAAHSDDLAFIVLMAGPGIPGDEIIMYQAEVIAKAEGIEGDELKKNLLLQRDLLDIVIEVEDDKKAAGEIRSILESMYAEMSEADKEILISVYGGIENYIEQTTEQLLLPWYRHFITYDPSPVLAEVRCPVLAINGSKDLQVEAGTNLLAIEEAFKKTGKKNYEIKEFPDMNHLFQHCETGHPAEYGQIKETISPDVLEYIAKWIRKEINELNK